MSTKKINTSNLNTDLNTDHLTPEQKEELEKMIKEITEEAKSVIEEWQHSSFSYKKSSIRRK